MTIKKFFEVMEQIHFVFGIPDFPESLEAAPEGIVE